ncbi:MAG: MltA domain-containing protein [Rhodomicrobium sp.]
MAVSVDGPLWRWQHARAEVPSIAVEPISFSAIPGWEDDNHRAALECYSRSAELIGQPSPSGDELLSKDHAEARAFFERTFAAFRVIAEPGLLTSYFEPVLKGSRTQSPAFPFPVYRCPDDLSILPEGHRLRELSLTAARKTPSGFEPYFTRTEIEDGALKSRGLEILYLADRIEAFIMHVQGSGQVQLEDGTSVRLTFEGKNGHPYTSIAKMLVQQGHLTIENAHLEGMLNWLRRQAVPQDFLNANKSFIFFGELDNSAEGPRGSSGIVLTASRSLATDPLYHPPGTPIWVEGKNLHLEGGPFRRLLVAQDSGSAIIGAQRGDVFAGCGENAGRIAGRIRHQCSFIVLRPQR